MNVYKIVKPVTTIKNLNGEDVPGIYNITAVPIDGSTIELKAVPTYESVANLDSGYKNIPELGAHFLGEVVHNVLYIIKFIDHTSPAAAALSTKTPKYKNIAVPAAPGEFHFKTPAFSFFSMLRNGAIKLVSSMGAYFYFDPYIPGKGTMELLDRFLMSVKNFVFNIYGGKVSWTNFEEDKKWKSEVAIDVYRGNSIDRDDDDKITIRAGSPTEDKDKIITMQIKHKAEDGKVSTHVLKIGNDIKIDSEYVGTKTSTHSMLVGDGVLITSKFEGTYEHTVEMKKDIRIQTKSDESKVYVGTANATAQPLATEYFVKQVFNQHKHVETGAMTGPPIPLAIIVPKDSKTGPTTFTTQGD